MMSEREQRYFAEASALLEKLQLLIDYQRAEFRQIASIVLQHGGREAIDAVVAHLEGSAARLEVALGQSVARH